MGTTILWQKVEGALVLAAGLCLYIFESANLPWWLAAGVFFAPDLSFASYLFGPRFGAFTYNLVHIYAFGAVCLAAGALLTIPLLSALGALWLAHSGFDRMLGYGLKSTEGFQFTHLGRIGQS